MTKKQIIQLMQDHPNVLLTGILTGRIAFTVKNFHALIGVAVHWFEQIRHLKEAIDRKTEINKTAREKYKRLSRRNMSLSSEIESMRYEITQLKKKLDGKDISYGKTESECLLEFELFDLRMKLCRLETENSLLRENVLKGSLPTRFQGYAGMPKGVVEPEIYSLLHCIHAN